MNKCDYCNKDATMNIQENTVYYSIDNEGNYSQISSENYGINEHYCDLHYVKEGVK